MKVSVERVPPVPSNYSDEELARHVRHYFPDLSGPLLTLLERFEANIHEGATADELQEQLDELYGTEDDLNALKEKVEGVEQQHSIRCPSCGINIQIDLELDLELES